MRIQAQQICGRFDAFHETRIFQKAMNFDPDTRISLIARMCDKSDNDAWSEFVQIYQPVIQRFVQKHGLQYADAAEVTQEVLGGVVKSIESWDGSKEGSTFRGWLFRITRNKAVDFIRKRAKQKVVNTDSQFGMSQFVDPKVTQPEQEFQIEYERQLFHWAAEKIQPTVKPVNWRAFWMSAIEGLTVDEVASELKIDSSTVYVARCRIMKRISKLVQERLNDSSDDRETGTAS